MRTEIDDHAVVEKRPWDAIDTHGRNVMPGSDVRPMRHFEPMTAFCEPDQGLIWFFTRSDTKFARSIEEGETAMLIIREGQTFQACGVGWLMFQVDPARVEKHWNPVVAAWRPQGKADPGLTLQCLDVAEAQIWIGDAGPIRFPFEVAKANIG